MDYHAVCCTLLLLTTSSVCFGQKLILPDNLISAVGESIVISPLNIPNPPYHSIRWRVNTTTIVVGPPNGIVIQSPYTDRASFDTSTLALELRNLLANDTGQYFLVVETDKESVTAQTTLQVHVPVSEVTIEPSVIEVELNSTVSFVCSASGSSLSFIWLNNSFEVTAGERVQLTDNNRNMTIISVIRGDKGPYECEASNSISKIKSRPVILTININGNDGGSLSAGVIAGIVIGVLLGVAAIVGLIFYFVKDKQVLGITSSGNKTNGASPNGQQELHYADIHHIQRQAGISRMPPDPTTSGTNKNATVDPAAVIYSDLRKA